MRAHTANDLYSGVAVGSSIGHAIGGFFGGGSSAPAEAQQADNAVASQAQDGTYQSNSWGARSCEQDAKSFTQCLDQNQGNMQICGWYLEQLVGLSSSLNYIHVDDGADSGVIAESMSIGCQPVLDSSIDVILEFLTGSTRAEGCKLGQGIQA